MRWNQQDRTFKAYFAVILGLSLPASIFSFSQLGYYSLEWASLAVVSVLVATINVRLPKISSVISMGDVFVILSLLYFGAGPTLVMYWMDIAVATFSDTVRKSGLDIRGKIVWHRFLFNLGCCALSVYAMEVSQAIAVRFVSPNLLMSLAAIAISWFVVNTVTLSLAISFWMKRSFWTVWREARAYMS